ncbi:hypothetical protein AOL_s00215g834 [Orbilia oligospora ATCC 24927]|uniref:Uncharacterized protein n=1 Tax=Arthrobotrys oligospora (strain ATCC 24927 / CBS 115.81 / DSM 1491) TaxID=756982 RepID=G1XV26_ARTOA|nr:hypothetical protein AOL_s00215g834 [Orbilia oligospora ATCC 24927]EGX43048.1 hypothetical protein AOL_s00215g834 [Orbilia oligospora ATCC 24927]
MSANQQKGFGGGIPAHSQHLPGSQKDMPNPKPEVSRLEGPGGKLYEYWGVGKLGGKKVLITGGDSGIGRSIAVLMAREGADISIVYLADEEADAKETKALVEKEKRKCLLIPFDLTQWKICNTVIDAHVQEYGRIDVLVNNAGKQEMENDFEKINLDTVESTFQANILQMFAITKYALPHMHKGSSIINSTSVVTFRGTSSMIDYASTKGAIVGFTRSLAKNLIKKGIRVNAVAPGPVHTPLQPASRPAEQMEGFGEGTQLGRPGEPSEVAPSYVFLASNESELYHGQILHPYALGD